MAGIMTGAFIKAELPQTALPLLSTPMVSSPAKLKKSRPPPPKARHGKKVSFPKHAQDISPMPPIGIEHPPRLPRGANAPVYNSNINRWYLRRRDEDGGIYQFDPVWDEWVLRPDAAPISNGSPARKSASRVSIQTTHPEPVARAAWPEEDDCDFFTPIHAPPREVVRTSNFFESSVATLLLEDFEASESSWAAQSTRKLYEIAIKEEEDYELG
ncbi:hypothetical protein BT63DRAFT_96726 [Microthyrium microscopicum]|uniref:Uncharacterized protein n=1 Tax=Microthyrium microscopicum TaxID=703497 RepID=A0A6A6TYD6_9PEZI|nr:hypothetical protein BT63DRAFT_96726 [Microthyrium microscopicum]